ncbi:MULTISPECIES: DUF2165 domain-containing protein [Pseudoalteromonas]|uniref:DUF2165 domain-containing protein n=1 Tax=Pseudoalteromonas amylolytica TaxID=1859457 RepID=A0A1S1MZF2_9GAMM|nr:MULTISPECIES: DUF2165 domain-containing protein [Pseudoalteromonas]MCF6435038.1 DUF2165 domain-containing protein [Pseudoalteromonas sp. MMG022]OHU90618.1 hypothetical protein BFC16_03160 [Pseudoalteromonas sp. JW3]OHU92761.1 hypothetical protein BET10_04735 [Pseudoalteromonas amylolytica]
MVRLLKIVLMFCVSCWGFVGVLSNLMDYAPGLEQVRYVLSMEGAADTPGIEWRSIHSPVIATLGFAVIYLSKFATGAVCLFAAYKMFEARNDDTAFEAAKQWGIFGCGISVVMLFLGFIVIAGEYFEYWRVPTLGMITHHYAFIYTMCLMSFILFLQSPEKHTK